MLFVRYSLAFPMTNLYWKPLVGSPIPTIFFLSTRLEVEILLKETESSIIRTNEYEICMKYILNMKNA